MLPTSKKSKRAPGDARDGGNKKIKLPARCFLKHSSSPNVLTNGDENTPNCTRVHHLDFSYLTAEANGLERVSKWTLKHSSSGAFLKECICHDWIVEDSSERGTRRCYRALLTT